MLAIPLGDEHIELFSSNSIGIWDGLFLFGKFLGIAKEIFGVFTDSIDSLIFFKCQVIVNSIFYVSICQ